VDISNTIALVGLAVAAIVADYKALKGELKAKVAGAWTVAGAALTALFLIYGDKFTDLF